MFKRIKRAYQAFIEPESFKWSGFVKPQNDPEGTEYKTVFSADFIPSPEGDGNAEFLGEGTTEEWEEQQKEDSGEKPWYDRIRNLK